MHSTPPETLLDGVATLTQLGVIRITGEDSAKFLHGQLTQDFALLGQETARLAAFCSAKGRMQASFIGFKRPDGDILLIVSRDLLPATLKRLSMFVMRAKARLSDASGEFALRGLAGSAIQMIDGRAHSTWSKADFDAATVVDLYPALGVQRQLWVGPVDAPAPTGAALPESVWAWSEVHSGIATLSGPVVDAFVPQMLNYESVGGVNFKKGCYPGQEVVARSQFRGTLKRRAFLVHSAQPLATGDAVFVPDDTEQPVATVVQSAISPQGGFDALISGQIAAIASGDIRLGNALGTPLTVLPLPYALLDDI